MPCWSRSRKERSGRRPGRARRARPSATCWRTPRDFLRSPADRLSRVGTRRIYSNPATSSWGRSSRNGPGWPSRHTWTRRSSSRLGLSSFELTGSPGWGGRCSLDDLLRFGQELLAPSSVAARRWRRDSGRLPRPGRRAARVRRPGSERLGARIRAARPEVAPLDGVANSASTFGHFGRSGTFLWVDPEIDLACAVLTDREFGPWAIEAWPVLSDAVVVSFTT